MRVTVHFVGICTHVQDTPLPLDTTGPLPAGTVTRVVLVDARNGLRVCDTPVPPHTAVLSIEPRFIFSTPEEIEGLNQTVAGVWTMSGVELKLGDSAEPLMWTKDYRCLPSLTRAAGQPALALDNRVVEEGPAACVFRIQAGTLEAYTTNDPSHAVVGKLTREDSDGTLIVTRTWDRSTFYIVLKNDENGEAPQIFVSNVGSVYDTPTDFMLHYRVTTWTPEECVGPENTCTIRPASLAETTAFDNAKTAINKVTGLTFGCSNAGWP